MEVYESMDGLMHGNHTLGIVGAALTASGRVRLVGLADQRQAIEVVPPEVLLRDTGNMNDILNVCDFQAPKFLTRYRVCSPSNRYVTIATTYQPVSTAQRGFPKILLL